MKKTLTTAFVLLLVVALAMPVFADDLIAAEPILPAQVPVSEDVPPDFIEYLEERVEKGFVGSMRAFEPDIPSGEFTYGGGYERIMFDPNGETRSVPNRASAIDSIFDLRDYMVGTIYEFIGYIDGEPEFVFEIVKKGDHYSTGTSILSAGAARAFESAAFTMLPYDGTKYVTAITSERCGVCAVDGDIELMTICYDPLAEEPVDAPLAGEEPVVFEAYEYSRHMLTKWQQKAAETAEYLREKGLPEGTIIVGAPVDTVSDFVPTHVVDLAGYERMKEARELRAVLLPAGAIAICGMGVATAAIYYRRTRKTGAN